MRVHNRETQLNLRDVRLPKRIITQELTSRVQSNCIDKSKEKDSGVGRGNSAD